MTELRNGQFNDLRMLEKLLISGNLISFIEDGTFETLKNVHTLSLQNNRLVNITKYILFFNKNLLKYSKLKNF